MSTLAFQPDAERYYSEGYWRAGDLWGEFARSAGAAPAKTALHVGELSISYDELRRAAIALSARLARDGVHRGDVVLLLGRNSIEAAVALLACFHLGAVAAPLPPMFGREQLAALAAQAGAKALIAFGGEAEIEKCEGLRGQIAARAAALARRRRGPDRRGRARGPRAGRRRRPRAAAALLRHDIGAEGDHALVQHAALRDRADPRTLGADRRGHEPGGLRVRLRREPGVRLPRDAACLARPACCCRDGTRTRRCD